MDPFEDLAVDDEDYNPSLESEEDEDDKEVTTTGSVRRLNFHSTFQQFKLPLLEAVLSEVK